MTLLEFERRYSQVWHELEAALDAVDGGSAKARSKKLVSTTAKPDITRLPMLFRQTCHHLALATDRQYPHFIVARLQALAARAHQAIYRAKPRFLKNLWRFATLEFPSLVRADARLALLSLLFFTLPLIALMIACYSEPETIYSVFDRSQVVTFERMYGAGAQAIGHERAADGDFQMFGLYIRNNIGISFQVFASGLLAGAGSLFYLALNGVFIGAVAGYLTAIGDGPTFWQFVCGHGAFELTAIVVSGMAGLKLGMAVLAPGRLTRRQALVRAAREAVRLMYGVAAMLLMAAVIEAFWSSSRLIPDVTKYGIAAMLWTAVAYYFLFQGRHTRWRTRHALR